MFNYGGTYTNEIVIFKSLLILKSPKLLEYSNVALSTKSINKLINNEMIYSKACPGELVNIKKNCLVHNVY